MVVKVYGPITAACPQRVLACLLEVGVDFELIPVDLESGEHKRPEFLLRQVRHIFHYLPIFSFNLSNFDKKIHTRLRVHIIMHSLCI